MAKKKPNQIVQPSVVEIGKPHVFEKLFDDHPEEMPVLKSVGFAQVEGTNTWVSYRLTTKGSDVLKIEVEEPDLREIVEETTKIAFVNTFMGDGLLP